MSSLNVLGCSLRIFLGEATSDCYLNAVVRKYCSGEDITPVPVKPPYLTKSLIEQIKIVMLQGKSLTSKHIYQVLLNEEFEIDQNFKLKIELENNDVDLSKASLLLNAEFISLPVRSQMTRFFHKLIYFEPEEAKVKNKTAICKLCDEPDISRNHIYFRCSKLFGIGREFMKILRILDPDYTEEEVLYLSVIDASLPQASWFIANTVFYISKNRENCSVSKYKAFLNTELETLKYSKFAEQSFVSSVGGFVELVGNTDGMV